jgi:hypothetical protein
MSVFAVEPISLTSRSLAFAGTSMQKEGWTECLGCREH